MGVIHVLHIDALGLLINIARSSLLLASKDDTSKNGKSSNTSKDEDPHWYTIITIGLVSSVWINLILWNNNRLSHSWVSDHNSSLKRIIISNIPICIIHNTKIGLSLSQN